MEDLGWVGHENYGLGNMGERTYVLKGRCFLLISIG
jgi:hypothetical protein